MAAPKTILFLSTLAVVLPTIAQAQTSTTQIASRLNGPVFTTAAPGDHDRMFFIEQGTGNVRVLDLATEEVLADPYLTVTNLARGFEKGLLGLAFHPDFASNGKLFVYASQNGGSQDHQSQVFEYTVEDPINNNVVDPSTQRSVLRFDQPFGNHNGGWIGFDPTATGDARNHLYIGTGDGGSANDPQNNSQDITNNLLGKLLRIDVNGDDFPSSDVLNYSIPASNPFASSEGDDEIFAYGLRNPWRTSFDRQTGDIWIGDVGQNQFEEIDLLPAGTSGQNFGWRVMEGNDCFNSGDARDGNLSCNDASLTSPVYDYGHNQGLFGGNSVTGGYVYRGPVKEFQGQYFFADWSSGHIWTRDPDSGEVLNRNSELEPDRGNVNSSIGSFGEDADGNLYVVSTGFSANSGSIYRIESSSRDAVWEGSTWTRDGVAGAEFVEGDHLIINERQLVFDEPSTVAALTFGGAQLSLSAPMEVTSGNITVRSAGTVTMSGDGSLAGTSGAIRKLGSGNLTLVLTEQSSDLLAIREGSVDLDGNTFARTNLASDTVLDARNVQFDVDSLNLELGSNVFLDSLNEDGSLMETPHMVNLLNADGEITISQAIDEALEAVLFERDLTILTASVVESIDGELSIQDRTGGGVLDNLNAGGFTIRTRWEQAGEGANLILEMVRGIPGDANLDGSVDFADFLVLSTNFGEPTLDWRDGTFSGGGVVQFADFLELANNFGTTGFESIIRAAPVPEPNALTMLVFGFGAMTLGCRPTKIRS